jgi:predicted membrane-bound spermidine synthase
MLRSLAAVPFSVVAGLMALLLTALAIRFRKGARGQAGLAVAAMGFVVLGLEVVLLLAFEAIHGYVYQQLALIIAGFMVGMALGSRAALQRTGSLHTLAAVQALGALAPLALVLLAAPSEVVFLVLAACCGALGGYQFPMASRLYFGEAGDGARGALYSLDLAGSCAAALMLSAWIIPVFGLARTALLLAIVNAIPAAMLLTSAGARRRPAP